MEFLVPQLVTKPFIANFILVLSVKRFRYISSFSFIILIIVVFAAAIQAIVEQNFTVSNFAPLKVIEPLLIDPRWINVRLEVDLNVML